MAKKKNKEVMKVAGAKNKYRRLEDGHMCSSDDSEIIDRIGEDSAFLMDT